MFLPGLAARYPLGAIAAGAAVVATVLFGCSTASADPAPPPPGCSAADLARVAAGVASATSAYLFTHPDVNDFLTSLHGRPDDQVHSDLQSYFDGNPQAQADLTGIRQPLADLRNRCEWEGGPGAA
jgi:hemophore-related protein